MTSSSLSNSTQKLPANQDQNWADENKNVMLQNFLNGSVILGTVIFFINLFIAIQKNDLMMGILTSALFIVLFIITFTKSIRFTIRSIVLSNLFIAVGVMSILSTGINANAVLYFFVAILLLGVLLPGSWWIAGFIFEGVIISIFGLFIQYGIVQLNSFFVINNTIVNWFITITITLFIAIVIVSPLVQYLKKIHSQKIEIEKNTEELNTSNDSLLQRVQSLENEADIQRSKQIAARQLIREITQQSNLQKMMNDLVELFCTQFGFNFAGIYISDERNEYAILRAASGQTGKHLIAQGHQLRIRDEGIVGYVVARGETRLALDVDVDSVHMKNPLLPETRSEVGIPLKTSSRTIGAIDIQSNKESAFTQDEIDILQGIADQLAITIEKALQINDLENEVSELRTGLGESVKGVWRTHLQGSRKNLGYVYKNNMLMESSNLPSLEATNLPLQAATVKYSEDQSELIVPIRLRDQVLGVINLNYSGKKVPTRLVNLVNTATDRLAVALENARLLETIQERADREHTVAEISSKVRSAQSVESILQTAVMELSKTLGVSEVSIQLKTLANTEQEMSVEE